MTETVDRNCLSFWFGRLYGAGLPVPRTRILHSPDLTPLLDGKPVPGYQEFLAELKDAARSLGGTPVFLRTGQTSNKHQWRTTCHVTDLSRLPHHVRALVEFSETCDFLGLPHHVWVVREMLPTNPLLLLPGYAGMPACREFRCFVEGGEVSCVHGYWPRAALEQGFPWLRKESVVVVGERECLDEQQLYERDLPADFERKYRALEELTPFDELAVRALAGAAGAALGGAWSVDVLETRKGFVVIDCAEAGRSYHREGCTAR